MVSIEKLVDLYNNFGDREKLSPLLSADEMLFDDNLTNKQRNWIERFIVVWDYTTNLDVQLKKKEKMKKAKKLDEMTNNELSEAWQKRINKYLVGRTIVKVEYCTEELADQQGWHCQPIQILLDNGTWLTPTSDDEGNNGGAIHTNIKELPIIPII